MAALEASIAGAKSQSEAEAQGRAKNGATPGQDRKTAAKK